MRCKCDSCNRPAREDGYCTGHSPERQRAIRKDNADRFKGYSLKRDYGISLEEYSELLKAQNNCCVICGAANGSERSNNNGRKSLSVDHDHITGAVRGLLCTLCNQAIGSLMDRPDLLRKAAAYIEAHEAKMEDASMFADELLNEIGRAE